MQAAQVQSLVRELRSYMLHGPARERKKERKKETLTYCSATSNSQLTCMMENETVGEFV